jgi:hypothetical protein
MTWFFSVGKKFMSLLASSILKVYNGVLDAEGLAVAAPTAINAKTTLTAAMTTACFLSMISHLL